MSTFINISIRIIVVLLLTTGCGPSIKTLSSWKNPSAEVNKTYKKIFVAALVNNPHIRTHLEEEMGRTAIAKGFMVERSWDYFPTSFSKKDPPQSDAMMNKINDLGCDLIFTITLVDKQSETRYVPGSMGMYGPYFGYGMRFGGFYYYWFPYVYDPGYYVTDKKYFMEGNIFDATSEQILWSIQTETLNPPSIEKFSKSLVEIMLEKAMAELNISR